ncbi:TPA: hypothetical protein ACMFMZ_001308 [Vibrio cholerae]
MQKLTPVLLLATAIVLPIHVNASKLKMSVSTSQNTALLRLTQDGTPVANYPVKVEGADNEAYQTSENGTLIIKNYEPHSQVVKFTVTDSTGNSQTEQSFLSRDW